MTYVELGVNEVDALAGWLVDNNGQGDGLMVFDLAGTAVRFMNSGGGRVSITIGDDPREGHRPIGGI